MYKFIILSIIIALVEIVVFLLIERKNRKYVKHISKEFSKEYTIIMFVFYSVIFVFTVGTTIYMYILEHSVSVDREFGFSVLVSLCSVMVALIIYIINSRTGVIQRAESQETSWEIKKHIDKNSTETQKNIQNEINAVKDEVTKDTNKRSSLDSAKNSTPVIPVYAQRKVKKRNYLQQRNRKRHSEHSS